jgi:miniconductance mechanosensitive channel
MINIVFEKLNEIKQFCAPYDYLLNLVLVFCYSFFFFFIGKRLISPSLKRLLSNRSNKWIAGLRKTSIQRVVPHLLLAAVNLVILKHWLEGTKLQFIYVFFKAYMTLGITFLFYNFLRATENFITSLEATKKAPVRGYFQLGSLFLFIIGTILAICQVMNISPLAFIGGIGAATTVILLVFSDTVRSFVSGIQISVNNLIQKGDWIQLDSHKINGVVEELSLNVVTVKNFDETITTLPTYKLLEQGFINWRNVFSAEARRMVKNFFIDQYSIRSLTKKEIDDLKKDPDIAPMFKTKKHFTEVNSQLFRRYLQWYADNHPEIRSDKTMLICYQNPDVYGMPLQIYIYSKTTTWVPFEDIQSEIMEHVVTMLPRFHLRINQRK